MTVLFAVIVSVMFLVLTALVIWAAWLYVNYEEEVALQKRNDFGKYFGSIRLLVMKTSHNINNLHLDKLVKSIIQFEKDINELKVLLNITIIPIAHSIRDIMEDTNSFSSRSKMRKLRNTLEELKKETDILERNLAVKEHNELQKLDMESGLSQELSYINQKDPSLAQSIDGFMSWATNSPGGKEELTGSGSVNKQIPETDKKVESIRLTQSVLKDILKEGNNDREKRGLSVNLNRNSLNATRERVEINLMQFAEEVSSIGGEKEEYGGDVMVQLTGGKKHYESIDDPQEAIHSNHAVSNNALSNDNLNGGKYFLVQDDTEILVKKSEDSEDDQKEYDASSIPITSTPIPVNVKTQKLENSALLI